MHVEDIDCKIYNLLVTSWKCHRELENSAIWGYFFGLLALSVPLHFVALALETVLLWKKANKIQTVKEALLVFVLSE